MGQCCLDNPRGGKELGSQAQDPQCTCQEMLGTWVGREGGFLSQPREPSGVSCTPLAPSPSPPWFRPALPYKGSHLVRRLPNLKRSCPFPEGLSENQQTWWVKQLAH